MIKGRLVKNFSLSEMENNEAKEDIKLIITPEVVEFAQMVQELRDWYGRPMKVNSWFRTEFYNKQIGGAPKSIHLDGRAVDIAISNPVQQNKIRSQWEWICSKHNKIGGINYYDTFIHIDNYEDKFGHKAFVKRDYRKE